MNANYVSNALCFHGQPLQKIWDDERGIEDLRKMRIQQPSYAIYQDRQKYFTFQERAKRLKLHQFLARKAKDLYDNSLVGNVMEEDVLLQGYKNIAQLPPFEFYMGNVKDKTKWWHYRLNGINPGDIIYASTIKTLTVGLHRVYVKPLCTSESHMRFLADIPLKAHIFQENLGLLPLDKQGNPRNYEFGELVRCELLEISVDAERMTLGMTRVLTKSTLKLGLVNLEEFPKFYRRTLNLENECYEDQLKESPEFKNPNYESLFQMNGININDKFSLMGMLKQEFPREEHAKELREAQASTWAFHYVADGIERFKNGQQVEAFQCLNKALNIDPRNVEGLVARGALYANKGSFLKAIEDFEKALKLNSFHVNARKYMGETLVALGHSYEEEQRIPEAIKAYTDCLNIIPNHDQARISLDILQRPSEAQNPSSYGLMSFPQNDNDPNLVHNQLENENGTVVKQNLSNDDESIGRSKTYNQPYYAIAADKKTLSSIKNVNEFKLEDDETLSQVCKLLRDGNKHKKSKKKEKEKKRHKKSKQNDLDSLDYMQKLDFDQAYRIMSGNESIIAGAIPNQNLDEYERSNTKNYIDNEEQRYQNPECTPQTSNKLPSNLSKVSSTAGDSEGSSPVPPPPKITQKLSFQIKRPVKVDKFGLVRVATPLIRNRSRTHSRSRSLSKPRRYKEIELTRRTQSISRSRSRSRSRRTIMSSRRTSRSRSPSGRFRNNYSNRRDRSPYRGRSRGRSRSRRYINSNVNYRRSPPLKIQRFSRERSPLNRRRTPSPFVPRGTPSPRSRYRRSRSINDRNNCRRSRSPRKHFHIGYNQTQRQRFQNRERRLTQENNISGSDGWNTDEDRQQKRQNKKNSGSKIEEPSIEEIDEIINKAQKERKKEIISRDKNILKK